MITRFYTWEVQVPLGASRMRTLDRAIAAAERVEKFNPEVNSVEVDLADKILRITVSFSGRDQWWIKKRVVFAIGAILSLSGLRGAPVNLVALERPEDRRSTRQRASDGRHNPIPDDVDIDHSDLGLEIA